jgi:nitronate monooxygenase
LVVAVSNAGGVGALGASWTPAGTLRRTIEDIRALCDRPFVVNFVNAFDQAERVALCAELRVPIVSFSWGVSPELTVQLTAAGVEVWQQVHDVAGARSAIEAGATALIAQSIEAGGHVEATDPAGSLLAQLHGCGVPVFAAGGIGDEAAAITAVSHGADGVVLGTRFVASSEANAHSCWKDGIVDAKADDTVYGIIFDRGWPDAPHRVLRNSTVRAWESSGSPLPTQRRPGEGDIVAHTGNTAHTRYGDDLPARTTAGDAEALAMYAGTSVDAISTIKPAADIVERFVRALS